MTNEFNSFIDRAFTVPLLDADYEKEIMIKVNRFFDDPKTLEMAKIQAYFINNPLTSDNITKLNPELSS